MKSTYTLENRILRMEERNRKVETDKAWETSWTRKAVIAFFTYLAVGLYMHAIHIPDAWLNAIVPSLGFLLSTLTLAFFKYTWKRYVYKN